MNDGSTDHWYHIDAETPLTFSPSVPRHDAKAVLDIPRRVA
jgi:hypothetical protein